MVITEEPSRIGKLSGLNLKRLRLYDGSLNFDYAHFIPSIKKCSVLHGHSSRVVVELIGEPSADGIVVDFGLLKSVTKSVLKDLDHKLIVADRYLRDVSDHEVTIEFLGANGRYTLRVPPSGVVITQFESTVENISSLIANRILESLPGNVLEVKVVVSEGFGKSASSKASRQ
ncbi:MAG: 6-carboxytetrahydropterin synthase [Aigarchaeota archaeon]|nr:6-carboxytetrahydropterin synthase [Aigarchaeota archaeon]MDW8092884.1 6-carboxytetrahydropterin synthase [Nitrososphaerota archaeon]